MRSRPAGSSLIAGRFSIGEILDLAASGTENGEDHLKTIFGWYHERSTAAVRGFLRTAAALAVAFLAAALADKGEIQEWHVLVGTAAGTFLVLLAVWTNWHLGHLHREFVISVRLLRQLRGHQRQLGALVERTGASDHAR